MVSTQLKNVSQIGSFRIISPNRDNKKKYLKPPPSKSLTIPDWLLYLSNLRYGAPHSRGFPIVSPLGRLCRSTQKELLILNYTPQKKTLKMVPHFKLMLSKVLSEMSPRGVISWQYKVDRGPGPFCLPSGYKMEGHRAPILMAENKWVSWGYFTLLIGMN